MHPIKPVTIKTPDGVERALRFTFGARRRIAEELGCNIIRAIIKLDDSALPAALYCCMFDESGMPPAGLTLAGYQETADPNQAQVMMQALRDAMEQGCATKNVLTVMDAGLAAMKIAEATSETKDGSASGASPANVSVFPSPNSGTSLQESSTLLPNAIASANGEPTTAPAS